MPYSCKLGISQINIQAYADDIVVLSPSLQGIKKVLHSLNNHLSYHGMLVNVSKMEIMVFRKSKNPVACRATFSIGEFPLEQVHQYKYWGSMITSNLSEKQDIVRLRHSFNRRVGMLYRKCHSIDQCLKLKLLNTLCKLFQGSELRFDAKGAVKQIHEFGVLVHIYVQQSHCIYETWSSTVQAFIEH